MDDEGVRRTRFVVQCWGHDSAESFGSYELACERALARIDELGFERVWLVRVDEESLPLPEPDPIVTDENGVPYERHQRPDFHDDVSFLRACWAVEERRAIARQHAFDEAFDKVMRETRKRARATPSGGEPR